MNQEILTILLGAFPILEARGAIPIAISAFSFAPLKAYSLGVLGTLLPIIPLLFSWRYLSGFLMRRFYFMNRILTRFFEYTRDKHEHRFQKHHDHHWRGFFELLALYIFVAIPLPFTGMWSGTVAAFVFGIPLWRAAATIALGVLTSGGIILLIVQGIVALPF